MIDSELLQRLDATDLYVVITEEFCRNRTALDVLDRVLDAGVTLVQMREKNLSDRELYALACAFRQRTERAGALFIVDDRVDIAMAADADGVHLGQDDMPIELARALAPDILIGASTHSLPEAQSAQNAGANYVNIGPIFETRTKDVPTGVVGPQMIDAISPHLRIPFSCMGGIKANNIKQVLARGARRPAVVTAVTAADDVEAAARELRTIISNYAHARANY